MSTFVRCAGLFDAVRDEMQTGRLLELGDDGRITALHDAADVAAARQALGSSVIDHEADFVVPGLIDIHVHLSYGNAQSEEQIDLYGSPELRAIRGLLNAQRVMQAGYTSIADPATTGRVSLAIRDAIEAGMFAGPRLSTAGRQITNRQGLSDWYPAWIGVPDTSVGVLATTAEEGIREIRLQIKEGVDFIKIAIDGDTMNSFTGLISGYTQEEVSAMVGEAHRLGKQVVVHARGAQAVLYSARARADVILHASWMCAEGLEAVLKNQCKICPSLTFPFNNVALSQHDDPAFRGFVKGHEREIESAVPVLSNARKAGVEFLVGTDSGFAVTPYGEWHSREIEIFVDNLGFSPAEALKCATRNNAAFLKEKGAAGTLEPGKLADFIVLKKNPLNDVGVLLDRSNIVAVYKSGRRVSLELPEEVAEIRGEKAMTFWNRVYDQAAARSLARRRANVVAAQ
jgi:imidazolonepropionase-like amidohydrolase